LTETTLAEDKDLPRCRIAVIRDGTGRKQGIMSGDAATRNVPATTVRHASAACEGEAAEGAACRVAHDERGAQARMGSTPLKSEVA